MRRDLSLDVAFLSIGSGVNLQLIGRVVAVDRAIRPVFCRVNRRGMGREDRSDRAIHFV